MANLAPFAKWDAESAVGAVPVGHRLLYRDLGPVAHDASYYVTCMLGGAIACGFTHAGTTLFNTTEVTCRCVSTFLSSPLPLSCTLSCKPPLDVDTLPRLSIELQAKTADCVAVLSGWCLPSGGRLRWNRLLLDHRPGGSLLDLYLYAMSRLYYLFSSCAAAGEQS